MSNDTLNLDADEKLIIKRNGKETELRFPSVCETLALEKDLKALDKDDVDGLYACQKKHIIQLGAAEELLDSLSLRKFLLLMETLQGKKK